MKFFFKICGQCNNDLETDIIEIGKCYKCYAFNCPTYMIEEKGKGFCCADKTACNERESDQMAQVRLEV